MMFRTLLFIPGNNKRFLEKSKFLYPDILCFDLEDSVPLSEKAIARNMIMESFISNKRSNHLDSNKDSKKIIIPIIKTKNHLNFLLELIHLNLNFMNKT